MIKRTFVRTRELKIGMIIDQSLIDRTGRILIARGTPLDEYLIDSLLKLGVTSVYIREGEEDPEDENISPQTLETIEKLKVPDRAKVKLSESVKKKSIGRNPIPFQQYILRYLYRYGQQHCT